jgi:hypothetical protein
MKNEGRRTSVRQLPRANPTHNEEKKQQPREKRRKRKNKQNKQNNNKKRDVLQRSLSVPLPVDPRPFVHSAGPRLEHTFTVPQATFYPTHVRAGIWPQECTIPRHGVVHHVPFVRHPIIPSHHPLPVHSAKLKLSFVLEASVECRLAHPVELAVSHISFVPNDFWPQRWFEVAGGAKRGGILQKEGMCKGDGRHWRR